jgi:uncharacterized protein YPO0396
VLELLGRSSGRPKSINERLRGCEGQSEWDRPCNDVRNKFVFATSRGWRINQLNATRIWLEAGKSAGQKAKPA